MLIQLSLIKCIISLVGGFGMELNEFYTINEQIPKNAQNQATL